MTTDVTFYDFVSRFETSDTYKNNFTRDGLIALFDYLEGLESDLGEPIEFDMVCICCDYTEFATAWEAMEQYQPNDMPVEGVEGDDLVEIAEKNEAEALRWLEDETEVIKFNNGVIIRDF